MRQIEVAGRQACKPAPWAGQGWEVGCAWGWEQAGQAQPELSRNRADQEGNRQAWHSLN